MLFLSRKVGESIVIGAVTVTVLGSQGGRLRLGITAPPKVPIRRAELPALPAHRGYHEEVAHDPAHHGATGRLTVR
jgi:carbon storage regulator